jgi:hypothetical protein
VLARLEAFDQLRIRTHEKHYKRNGGDLHPEVETSTFPDTLKRLAALGIITFARRSLGNVSRMQEGPWLRDQLDTVEFGKSSVALDNHRPCVILRHRKPREDELRVGGKPGKGRKPFPLSKHAASQITQMKTLNVQLQALTIDLHWDASVEGSPSPPWDINQRWLYRVFTHGRVQLDRHGRMYGGFWIAMPKEERWRITIDGESLVQLDLSAAFVSILYAWAREGRPADPFVIEEVVQAYIALGYGEPNARRLARQSVKMLMNARLFDNGNRQRYPRASVENDGRQRWPRKGERGMRVEDMLDAISRRHCSIANHIANTLKGHGEAESDHYKEEIGHRLFLEESEIILEALETCLAEGIPALPVHDAILVKRSDYERAGEMLAGAFHQRLSAEGYTAWPVIKSKPLHDPFVQEGYLRPANLGDCERELRSIDGVAKPVWSERSIPKPNTRKLREAEMGRVTIARAIALAYITRGDLIVRALNMGQEVGASSLLGKLLLALAHQDNAMRNRWRLDELTDEGERADLLDLIAVELRDCIRSAVLELRRPQLEELVRELKKAGLIDQGFEVEKFGPLSAGPPAEREPLD